MKNLAGRLNQRIAIEQEIRTADGLGGFISTWQFMRNIWAEVKPSSIHAVGKEKLIHDKIDDLNIYRFVVRYADDIDHKMRISFDGRYFNIRSVVSPDGNKTILYIYASEEI